MQSHDRLTVVTLVLMLVHLLSLSVWGFITPATPIVNSKQKILQRVSNLPHAPSLAGRRIILAVDNTQLSQSSNDDNEGETQGEEKKKKGFLSSIFNPYNSEIPEEIRDEIYAAEAKTPAAQDRGKRIALYALIAFTGILLAFFNAFLSELRSGGSTTVDGIPIDLEQAGFGWVVNNAFFSFLFLNKIGGGICLITGAGAGLLAEAEYDTRRFNAEKIFEELKRRKESKEKKKTGRKKKKRPSGRNVKRQSALAEVVLEDEKETKIEPEMEVTKVESRETEEKKQETKDGIFGKLKGLYEKADTMAASQALLLNKKLEEQGLVEKITDETGLRVIGREEAAKLKQKKQQQGEQVTTQDKDSTSEKN